MFVPIATDPETGEALGFDFEVEPATEQMLCGDLLVSNMTDIQRGVACIDMVELFIELRRRTSA